MRHRFRRTHTESVRWQFSDSPLPIPVELRPEQFETVFADRMAHFVHQLQVVMQIVDRAELRTQYFADTAQMMQIGA